MVATERVTFFGDIKGINVNYIRLFTEVTDHLYGGSYPNRQEGISDEELTGTTHALLTGAGIFNPDPIILCNSIEERITKILQVCNLRRVQNGEGLYWIIDRDQQSLLESVKSVKDREDLQTSILNSITVVQLGSEQILDRLDVVTGIRVVSFPPALHRFPTHPTPAS